MKNKLPGITIAIPTYNEEKNIKMCLESIFKQDYPKEQLEIFVVDNYSQDKTLDIVRGYPVKVLMNKIKDAQVSKMIAFRKARNELFYYMDADLEFKNVDYLKSLVYPLLDDPRIIGSFGKLSQVPRDTSLNRFLTYDNLQRDPLCEYFSPSIGQMVIENKKKYILCKYEPGKIPPSGRCLYWKEKLMLTSIATGEKFMELDNLVILVKSGYCYFGYVPQAQEYHRHIIGIKSLIKKRLRNIRKNYLPHYETRLYTWFDLGSKRDVVKIIFWIIYAHLIVPALIKGCYKAVRYGDIFCVFYEPLLTLLLTDVILYGFFSNHRNLVFLREKLFITSKSVQ